MYINKHMPFSISKLQSFLGMHNLVALRYFTQEKYVCYIEILNLKTSDTFLLYIPTKYDFKSLKTSSTYKLEEIDISSKKYAESPGEQEMGDLYDLEINIRESSKMEEELEKNYKRTLKLKSSNETEAILRSIVIVLC